MMASPYADADHTADHAAVIANRKADHDARIAREKADHDAQIAAKKADSDARIAREKADHDARLATEKAFEDKVAAWQSANRTADVDNFAKFNDAMYTLAASSVERARGGADLVQKASAAIATLYTGALALVFSVTDNPLPARGILTPVFLGLAVVLSTAYIAYLGPSRGYTRGPTSEIALERKSFQRLNTFIAAASLLATRRSGLLRASVVSLGAGLIFIAAPFVSFASNGSNSAVAGTVPPNAPAWPTPATGTPNAEELALFQAQVNEVATARTAAATAAKPDDHDLVVLWSGLVVGLLAVILVPLALRGDARTAPAEKHDPPPG